MLGEQEIPKVGHDLVEEGGHHVDAAALTQVDRHRLAVPEHTVHLSRHHVAIPVQLIHLSRYHVAIPEHSLHFN